MADTKISALSDGSPRLTTDEIVIARSGSNFKLPGSSISPIGLTELIYRYTVAGSDKASIDTGADTADAGSNVWTGGDLLEIFICARTDSASASTSLLMTLNNDTGSNYDRQLLRGNNTSASATPSLAQTSWNLAVHGSGGSASYPSALRITIPNFTGTTFFKQAEATVGSQDATAGNNVMDVYGIGYRSTSAITRLKIIGFGTDKFKVGSQLLIYKRRSS